MNYARIDLRIKAERIIRADRVANGRDVSNLNFEEQYINALRDFNAFLTRINRALDNL